MTLINRSRPVSAARRACRWAVSLGCVLLATHLAGAQVGPTTVPATRPLAAVDVTPADGPTAVPFVLSGTDHVIMRVKINGHGPYNFVMDTGAPTLLVDETVGEQIGLVADPSARPAGSPATRPSTRPTRQHWSTINRLDIEGGLSMSKVKCLVLTPYQITGMNAMGVAGMDLHGLMGYSVLARFKIELDMTRHIMMWTPQADFVPAPLRHGSGGGDKGNGDEEAREAGLESMGGVLKVLGPLVKASMPGPPRPRGWVGVELAGLPGPTAPGAVHGVSVSKVLPDSPAERAGVRAGDVLTTVDGHPVASVAQAEADVAHLLAGQDVRLGVWRTGGTTTKAATVTVGNTTTTTTTITNVTTNLTVTCGEGL